MGGFGGGGGGGGEGQCNKWCLRGNLCENIILLGSTLVDVI